MAGKYLVIKADAGHLPLRARSAGMMIATPPFIGAIRFRKGDFCTDDAEQYRRWIKGFLGEAMRIMKPGAYLLMSGSREPRLTGVGKRRVEFGVFRKQRQEGRWVFQRTGTEAFWTHFMRVRSCWWACRPSLYRELIVKYSQPGDVVVHVFSGSGNSGVAAVATNRKPILIDRHYQRDALRRVEAEAAENSVELEATAWARAPARQPAKRRRYV